MDDLEAGAGDPEELSVRPYTITQGRTAPSRDDLTLITIVTTAEPAPGRAATRGLQPEHHAILRQCRGSAAVAEISAELNLPVSVTKILIDDLVTCGQVTTRAPIAMAAGNEADMNLLRAVRDGLRRL